MKRKLSKILGVAITIALLMSLLVSAAPAAAMSQPQVAATALGGTAYEISKTNVYTVTFTAGVKLAAGDFIDIYFPAGGPGLTDMNATGALNDVIIEATTGIGGGPLTPAGNAVYAITGSAVLGWTLTITVPGLGIGAGSLVGLVIGTATGVNNPASPGSYTITVASKTAALVPVEAAVTSAPITINAPGITPLPGVVLAYNSAGILMSQSNSINTAIGLAGQSGRIEVGPGTYDETIVVPNVAASRGLTIVATGEAGTVIVQDTAATAALGTLTVNVIATQLLPFTFDGFTFKQNIFKLPATPITIGAAAAWVTITNCDIEGGTTSAITSNGGGANTVSNCNIIANGTGNRVGIDANDQMTITGCTFDIGDTDMAIDTVAGAAAPAQTSITNCVFTGSSGSGIDVTGGVAYITGCTFNNLYNAITQTAGTVVVKDSTIDGCGGTATTVANAVQVNGGVAFTMTNSTVQNTQENNWAFDVAAGAGTVTVNFNNIVGNAKNVRNAKVVVAPVVIPFDHNWWGVSTGPAATTMSATGSAVTTTPLLTGPNGAAAVVYGLNGIAAKDTVGVNVDGYTAAGVPSPSGTIGVNKYAENPQLVAPPITGTGEVIGYYDVYVNAPAAVIQVKFYGNVTQYTKVYYAGGLNGQWSEPSNWGVNVAGGYVYVTVNAGVTPTTPTLTDLSGLPFAVVEDKILTAPNIAAAAGGSPTLGAYDISTNPTFTWAPVLGVDHYEIALCEDPSFTIIEWAYNVNDPFFKADEALRYDTTYYWRVRGVIDAAATAFTPWATGIFTTEAEPVDPADATPVVIDPVKPEVNVEIPPTKITVEPSTPAIPTYMLWIIVVVGAVLIIALIVLIVRTRRVA